MVTLHTAYTIEADDADYAFQEIMEQLQLESNQKKYSVGMIFCHTDFTESGVAQAISKKMPFDVIGITFVGTMTQDMDDPLMLAFSLFTSDEVEFSTIKVENLAEEGAMAQAYAEAVSDHLCPPALIMAYFPLTMPRSVESFLEELDEASNNTPVYGGIAVDFTPDYSLWQVLYNGEISRNIISAILFFGDIQPQFFTSTMSNKYVQTHKSIITKSEKNILMEVNDKPFIEYLYDNGFEKGVSGAGLGGTPMLIDFDDGTPPISRGVAGLTPEGYAVMPGEAPAGALISLGSIDYAHVLDMTEEVVRSAMNSGKKGPVIIHPCASHLLLMGVGVQEQKDNIRRFINLDFNYAVGYSGGEICPVYDSNGMIKNRLHSYTFVLCIL